MKSPTLSDVARAAGVSYATADRVINNRGNVAQKSVVKVHDAVAALGYVRNVAAANLSRRRTPRLAFLLPRGPNAFFNRMRAELDALIHHMQAEQVQVDVIDVDAFAITALRDSLLEIADAGFDGIAVVGLQSEMLEAPLQRLADRGVSVVSLVSDLPRAHRAAYVGIDNLAAGRTAGRLMGLSHAGQTGCVQILAGSLDAGDHRDRITGFRQVMAEDYPQLALLPTIMTRDDAQVAKRAMIQALDRTPDVTGVYNAGAGNDGLIAALPQAAAPKRPTCILHELGTHTRQALHAKQVDLVIDQRPDIEINRAFALLRAMAEARPLPPPQDLIPTIYVRENLPSDAPQSKMKETRP